MPSKRKRILPPFTGVEAPPDPARDPLRVIRVHQVLPSRAPHLLEGPPRVMVPALVVPVRAEPDASADQASWSMLSASVRNRSSFASTSWAVSARSAAFSAAGTRASMDLVFSTVIEPRGAMSLDVEIFRRAAARRHNSPTTT